MLQALACLGMKIPMLETFSYGLHTTADSRKHLGQRTSTSFWNFPLPRNIVGDTIHGAITPLLCSCFYALC